MQETSQQRMPQQDSSKPEDNYKLPNTSSDPTSADTRTIPIGQMLKVLEGAAAIRAIRELDTKEINRKGLEAISSDLRNNQVPISAVYQFASQRYGLSQQDVDESMRKYYPSRGEVVNALKKYGVRIPQEVMSREYVNRLFFALQTAFPEERFSEACHRSNFDSLHGFDIYQNSGGPQMKRGQFLFWKRKKAIPKGSKKVAFVERNARSITFYDSATFAACGKMIEEFSKDFGRIPSIECAFTLPQR
jgi:hypothetical protein